MNRNSKRAIASFAALEILLYHCWIPVFPYGTAAGAVERYLIAAAYPGVDTFFFLSAFSLVSRPVEDYGRFLRSRAVRILPLFFIAWAAGRFLWFLPSVMLLYVLLPPLHRVCRKRPTLSAFLLICGWGGLVYLILGVIRPAQDPGIVLFRIPGMILGAYAVRFRDRLTPRRTLAAGLLLLAVGNGLLYSFGYLNKLHVPFYGTFYLMGIPVMLGGVLLLDLLFSGHSSRVIGWFGSMTLELYFSQMMFGTLLTGTFFRLTGSRIVTNGAVLLSVILAAAVIRQFSRRLSGLLSPKPASGA